MCPWLSAPVDWLTNCFIGFFLRLFPSSFCHWFQGNFKQMSLFSLISCLSAQRFLLKPLCRCDCCLLCLYLPLRLWWWWSLQQQRWDIFFFSSTLSSFCETQRVTVFPFFFLCWSGTPAQMSLLPLTADFFVLLSSYLLIFCMMSFALHLKTIHIDWLY